MVWNGKGCSASTLALVSLALSGCAQGGGGGGDEADVRGSEGASSHVTSALAVSPVAPAAPTVVASELLGRPTDHAVTLKVTLDQAVQAYVEYGKTSATYSGQTTPAVFSDGMVELKIAGLEANAAYYYRLRYRASGATTEYLAGGEHRFRTQRDAASTFTFDIQSDSHMGFAGFYSSALYGVTLQNIASDHPDFLFDLGDTVSTDDATETQASVRQKYGDQRAFFDIVAHSSPVYLVLGNHENEEGWNLDDYGTNTAASLPVLGANARKRFFANPVPDGFYSGNTDKLAAIDGDHLRGDYYAFEWGPALFVAIDPYWYTTKKPYAGAEGGEKDDEVVGNRWDWTLGKAQYDWLEQTLADSNAQFKFVFAHQMTGGNADYGRAGALGAKYVEWGGYDTDGTTYSFATHRPGWGKPVHHVLADGGVTAFFHAHDHIFAQETLDGVVYQELPHAANPDYGSGFASNATDYANAVRVNNSGHLRVTVSPALVTVDYVRAFLAGDGDNGSVAYTYTISPCLAAGSDGKKCDDGNACTTNDACQSGACKGYGALSCDDGNGCTDDSCNPTSGCVHTSNTAACDDGSACTTGDVCGAGACVSGAAVVCAKLDECHLAGVCSAENGACANPAADDGTPCTGGHCVVGICVPLPGSGGTGGTGGSETGGTAGTGGSGAGGIAGTGGSGAGGIAGTGGSGAGGAAGTGGSGTGGTGTGGTDGGAAGEAGAAGAGQAGAAGDDSGGAPSGQGGKAGNGGSGGKRHASDGGHDSHDEGGGVGGTAGRGGASVGRGGGGSPNVTPEAGQRVPTPQKAGCACSLPQRDDGRPYVALGAFMSAALVSRRKRRAEA